MSVLYAAKASTVTASDLYSVDPDTGAVTSIGASGYAITGLAQHPTTNVLYGVTSGNSSASPRNLITLDPATGGGTVIGALGVAIADIAFDSSGVLYGARTDKSLYTINLSTGAATLVGSYGSLPTSFGFGMSFSSGDVLYSIPTGDDQQLYTINTSTGAATDTGVSLTGAPNAGVSSGSVPAASFDPTGTTFYCIDEEQGGLNGHLCTVDLATGAFTDIGLMGDRFDALAWGGTPSGPRLHLRFRAAT